jgi:precorrin-2 dehydrogenase/sirohydrochlorin ferrochelatase
VLLDGVRITALVVGGGAVAARKALALLEAGASVRVVAPTIAGTLGELAERFPGLTLVRREYAADDVGVATLVVAATGVRAVNAAVARDALALGRLVNVADAPDEGNFVTAATHRAGALVVAVSAGGVPTAAARVRDAIARRFDDRYAAALESLAALRRRTLREGGSAAWRRAADALVGEDFCAAVESGTFDQRVASWR